MDLYQVWSNYALGPKMAMPQQWFFLPVHPASFTQFLLWDAKFLFQRVPGCNGIADLSWKIVFWTHKFAVWLIDMGNSESQDPWAQNCKWITAQGSHVTQAYMHIGKNMKKIFLSETIRPRALIFGMKHDLVDLYQVCSNYAPLPKGSHVLHRLILGKHCKSSCLKP